MPLEAQGANLCTCFVGRNPWVPESSSGEKETMAFKYAVVAGLVFLLCLVVMGKKGPADNRVEALELTSVTREIDLTSPLVKQKVTMVVENKASKSVSALYFTVERQLAKRLAFIDAQVLFLECWRFSCFSCLFAGTSR